jgi:hypothetical protein
MILTYSLQSLTEYHPLALTVRVVITLLALANGLQAFPAQEHRHGDRDRALGKTDSGAIIKTIENLRDSVNGKTVVRTRCNSQNREAEVEERTEIVDVSDCNLTVRTRKITTSGPDRRELEFTIYANLAELTTPVSVQPQTFAQCKSVDGPVVKVMSRTKPGKSLRATRRSRSANTTENADQIQRNDLSFFFPDDAKAKKAARALDQAVRHCGGKEWPDEDDLP